MFKHVQTLSKRKQNGKGMLNSEVLLNFAHAEFSSAIEMLQASKLTEDKKLARGFVNHCLDEYRHTNFFLKLLNISSSSLRFLPRHSIRLGFLNTEKFLFERLDMSEFAAFVGVNENEARELFLTLKNDVVLSSRVLEQELAGIIEDEKSHHQDFKNLQSEFLSLLNDEQRHSQLSFKYLKKICTDQKSIFLTKRFIVGNKVRHFFAKKSKIKSMLETFIMLIVITAIIPLSKVFFLRPIRGQELLSKKRSNTML